MHVPIVMKLQAVLIVLISTASLSSQSCGSTHCSQDYDTSCPPDESCYLYHNCKTSKSKCDSDMGPADALSVDCYDTCIEGHPLDPSIPFKCCADQRLVSEAISITTGEGYLIARLYSPNEPGLGVYRHNTFCKYNIQCPSNDYDLHYLMVRFDIEPPQSNGKCLDFLRYHFTATGASVDSDACGELGDLTSKLTSGAHGSSLTLDFRSNRINRKVDFFLSVVCVNPNPVQATGRRKRATHISIPSHGPSKSDLGLTTRSTDCTPTMSYGHKIVPNFNNIQKSSMDYLYKLFPRMKQSYMVRRITVTRSGVVIYRDNTIYVKIEGKVKYRFRNIRMLYVTNKIEGYLRFTRNASPLTRVFPGYGFLRVGSRIARYYQTIVNPKFLLSDEEQVIVRDLYNELYNRNSFDSERFYFTAPRILTYSYDKVNCSINQLAELNSRSCTDVVRAAANFFLKKDNFQKYCRESL